MSTVVAAGTTPPTVTLTGTDGYYDVHRGHHGGARGTARVKWSSDGGATYHHGRRHHGRDGDAHGHGPDRELPATGTNY